MPEVHDSRNHARPRSGQSIGHWRRQRRQLGDCLLRACLAAPAQRAATLHRLCQTLVDYLAVGHFTVYARLLDRPPGGRCHALSAQLLQLIGHSTDHAIGFNDRHGEAGANTPSEHELQAELVLLASLLSLRFKLEDQLIALLRQAPARDRGTSG